uniref:Sodium leak channel NALCN n=1 Tax=Ditylenchus dipsaci TaxID=166011 RepID=A0A915EEL3_9BILA
MRRSLDSSATSRISFSGGSGIVGRGSDPFAMPPYPNSSTSLRAGSGGRKMSLFVAAKHSHQHHLIGSVGQFGCSQGATENMLLGSGLHIYQRKYSVSVSKAAVLSSATLQQQQQQNRKMSPAVGPLQQNRTDNRRRSIIHSTTNTSTSALGQQTAAMGVPGQKRDSMAAIVDLLAGTSLANSKKMGQSSILDSPKIEKWLKLMCLVSLVTVCLNTPRTLELLPVLNLPILIADLLVNFTFTAETALKANRLGYFRRKSAYFRDRWCQFDFFLLLFHWLSWVLHVYQVVSIRLPLLALPYYNWLGVLRCVRPMIIIRLIRLMIKFKLPRNRIQQLLRRSSSQVQNVTVFFVFFMAFYAIMGIQLFGRMDYHCVVPGTDPKNVTINDLAIPDTMCSKKGGGGYECPGQMQCVKVDLSAKAEGFYGMFDHFGASVFTVYLAASEEGWVYVLYDCLDSLPSHLAFIYFVTLIFFMAWLVKNVFIAVITETFAEIRVQFSEMWQKKEVTVDDDFKQKIERTEDGTWQLIRLDTDDKNISPRVKQFQTILRSTAFQCVLVSLVLTNAIINASFVYHHDKSDLSRRRIYYYIECGFTMFFNIECLVKMLCYGWAAYFKRNIFKFEFILCLGSSLNAIKYFYDRNVFTYFQVFRLFRLIKASPMLEDFVYKIFSPGKKLGGLVIFTVTFVIIASAVSLQLFCSVPKLHHFQTFPQAFMAMFQIITQEGWTEFVVEVLRMIDDRMVPFVAIYFVAYHLFVTLIVLSLFVAVILDNLEMDEELKKVKQLKAKEAISCMRSTLPWRLRIFEKFPTRPQMVRLKKVDGEFPTPRVRDSFTHQFVWDLEQDLNCYLLNNLKDHEEMGNRKLLLKGVESKLRTPSAPILARHVGHLTMRAGVNALIRNAVTQATRQSQVRNRQKSIGFFDKILTAENGDIGGGRSVGDTSAPTASSHMTSTIIASSSTRRPPAGPAGVDLKQDFRVLQQKRQMAEMTRNRIESDMKENHPFFDRPLFMVGRDSKLRKYCYRLVHARYDPTGAEGGNGTGAPQSSGKGTAGAGKKYKQIHGLVGLMPYLDWAMVVVTLISCVSMLFESPWPTTGENLVMNNIYLQVPDYLFVLSMTIELGAKVVADGLFFTPNAIIKDIGGLMTIFIYFTSVIFLLTMPKHVEINSIWQFLMICRAMRPLRIYTLVPHIRRVVVELFRGFKEILLVTILMIVVMFIFASFGVQTVGGRLAACNDPSVTGRQNCTGVFWQKIFVTRMEVYGKNTEELHPKILVPRVWTNPRNFNFDHIGSAMLALFETLSYKGWNVIRDILWARQGPWAVVFIHIYVFIGCMIGLTLFVGVVIANYTENRGTALLTVDQRRWHDLKARLKMAQPLHVPPKPSESAVMRRRLYELTMSRSFNQFFAVLVVLNSATLLLPWNVEEEENEMHNILYFITAMSAFINCLFAVEILLKVMAFTASGFWQSRRNRIDLLITALGISCWRWVVAAAEKGFKRFTYTLGYVIVVLRFFTIAGRNTTLKMLMLTVIMSVFRSFFIIMAMVLLVLFYAYTGVILFGMVKYGQAVSKHVNFRSGSEALVVLFRSVTGEDWNDIMHDSSRSAPFCYWRPGMNYWETDCGNYYGALIYFCSFYLIITYIVRNLLVAIIMENFSLFYSSEEDALLSYADIRNFQLVWNMVDVEQKGAIPVRRVKFLLRLLKGRLEVDPNKDRLLFKHMCYEMEKLHNGEDVSFHDVLYMLSYRSVDIRKSLQLEELLQREELEYIIEEEVAKQTIKCWLEMCLRQMRSPTHKESSTAATGFSTAASLRSVFGFDAPLTHPKLSVIPSAQNLAAETAEAVFNGQPEVEEKEILLRKSAIGSLGAKTVGYQSPKKHMPIGDNIKVVSSGFSGRSSGVANLEPQPVIAQATLMENHIARELEQVSEWGDNFTSMANAAAAARLKRARSRRKSISDVIEDAAKKFMTSTPSTSTTGMPKKSSWSGKICGTGELDRTSNNSSPAAQNRLQQQRLSAHDLPDLDEIYEDYSGLLAGKPEVPYWLSPNSPPMTPPIMLLEPVGGSNLAQGKLLDRLERRVIEQ